MYISELYLTVNISISLTQDHKLLGLSCVNIFFLKPMDQSKPNLYVANVR